LFYNMSADAGRPPDYDVVVMSSGRARQTLAGDETAVRLVSSAAASGGHFFGSGANLADTARANARTPMGSRH
jgi:hypothetical protein